MTLAPARTAVCATSNAASRIVSHPLARAAPTCLAAPQERATPPRCNQRAREHLTHDNAGHNPARAPHPRQPPRTPRATQQTGDDTQVAKDTAPTDHPPTAAARVRLHSTSSARGRGLGLQDGVDHRRRVLWRLVSVTAAAAADPAAGCGTAPPARDVEDYDRYAESYDALDGGALPALLGWDTLRQQLLQQAAGDVLELGVGSGLNLPLYDGRRVVHVTGVDASAAMLAIAARRGAGRPVALVQGDVEALPFAEGSFDTVVDTFGLCVFRRPRAALAEAARVLRPGGRLLLLENSRSSLPLLAAYQDATAPLVTPASKGCAWNVDVLALLRDSGFHVVDSSSHTLGLITRVVGMRP